MLATIIKRFENPDETRVFEKGRFEIVHLGGLTIGRATYEPGWKWSVHVAPVAGTSLCLVEHVGLTISGRAVAAFEDGSVVAAHTRRLVSHSCQTARQLGSRRRVYVSLHFLGAEHYSAPIESE